MLGYSTMVLVLEKLKLPMELDFLLVVCRFPILNLILMVEKLKQVELILEVKVVKLVLVGQLIMRLLGILMFMVILQHQIFVLLMYLMQQ